MNVNYIGSLSERRMRFLSSLTVEELKSSDLFDGVSVYMPRSFAAVNIVGFDPAIVTKDKPAVLVLTVDNYAEEVKGDLLAQITPIFRQDTNFDATVFIIVFYDTDIVPTMWDAGAKYISFEPLTKAFQQLFFLSYIKFLFDPTYDGENVTIPGTNATAELTFTNGGLADVTLSAGSYTHNDGTKTWQFTIDDDVVLAPDDSFTPVDAAATTVGPATLVQGATIPPASVTPEMDANLEILVATLINGTAPTTRPSMYHDLALCLAYLAKTNMKLSTFWAIARISFSKIDFVAGTDTNKCLIRTKTAAEERLAMVSIETSDRVKYFWGALALMEAESTFLAVDCEERNVLSIMLNEWFAAKNGAGVYVGNKLSLLRVTAQRCFGPPSPINAEFNAGDPDGYDIFDSKNVGCLAPISGSNSGDSYMSMCRGVTGFPINALMIGKYADYRSSEDTADMITDKGTLTNPVLTNEEAYKKIQNIVIGNISAFAATKRISGVVAKFPAFNVAKVGRTALEAASSWQADYVDDLDSVTVSGGIVAS